MADPTVSWSRNPTVFSVDPNEKLFVFGYSCKIFRDDEKAMYIDQGKHLIPWMGDKSLMIDRYDVRGYLHDLKQYEPKPEGYDNDVMSEEESQCDEERYRSLRSDMSEEQLYHEEELKRLRAAIAGDGAYHEIAFTYENAESEKYEEAPKVEEPEDELFQLPKGLSVPKEMELPYTMKIHAIIEKTALFVSQQGGQMEIIIKMKQHANPQFAFMHLDNPLYPYYKHLVKEIKSGAYKPVEVKKVSQSEDEDDDGHYLHPSLMAGRPEAVPKFTVPTINFRRSSDDSYSVLVRNLQQHFVEDTPVESPATEETAEKVLENNQLNLANSGNRDLSTFDCSIIPPPPDFQPIVDKMAEYVAKNGDDFEIIVKSRKDKRFDFLHPWHEFYKYYVFKRDQAKVSFSSHGSSQLLEAAHYGMSSNSGILCQESTSSQRMLQREEDKCNIISKEEFDDLYKDSKDPESSDSMDFLNSPEEDFDDHKTKPSKVLKGPICFSLKSRDTDTPTDKTNSTALLLDDSESSAEEGASEKDREDTSRRKKSHEAAQVHHSRSGAMTAEVKTPRPNSEFLEAKHAEERIRDKLLATARERMAQQRKEKQLEQDRLKREEQLKKERQLQLDQQRKEKQLQLERKKKAELFLKMLKKKTPDSSAIVSHIIGSDKVSQKFHQGKKILHSTNNIPPTIPGIKTDWSSDSASEHSGEEEPISVIGAQLSSEGEEADPPKDTPTTEPDPSRGKSERKRRKRSKSRERSSKSKKKRKSKSPPSRYKEKELPAAYALNKRSRSRSRSPRRYRPTFNHWNRRR